VLRNKLIGATKINYACMIHRCQNCHTYFFNKHTTYLFLIQDKQIQINFSKQIKKFPKKKLKPSYG